MAKSKKLKVGIVGLGGIGRGPHVPIWAKHPDVEIVAMADIIPERAISAAEEYGVPHAFDDHRKLLKLKEIDAVDVCTPNLAHAPVVINALKAGKHVICEKPVSVTPKKIEAMILAARKARRKFAVIQNHRFTGIATALKRFIEAGHLGTPYYARAWAIRRNLLPTAPGFTSRAQSGGGACMDIGVHCLDLAMWLLDFPEPVTVTGMATNKLAKAGDIPGEWGEWDKRKIDVEDFACGMVRFKNGAMLSLESCWLGHLPDPEVMKCSIFGDKAGVTWPTGQVNTVTAGVLVDAELKPVRLPIESHEAEIHAFHKCIVDNKPVPVTPEQSLKVIRILDGIYRSQKLGREVRV